MIRSRDSIRIAVFGRYFQIHSNRKKTWSEKDRQFGKVIVGQLAPCRPLGRWFHVCRRMSMRGQRSDTAESWQTTVTGAALTVYENGIAAKPNQRFTSLFRQIDIWRDYRKIASIFEFRQGSIGVRDKLTCSYNGHRHVRGETEPGTARAADIYRQPLHLTQTLLNSEPDTKNSMPQLYPPRPNFLSASLPLLLFILL